MPNYTNKFKMETDFFSSGSKYLVNLSISHLKILDDMQYESLIPIIAIGIITAISRYRK